LIFTIRGKLKRVTPYDGSIQKLLVDTACLYDI
jgi:hypothetical protein